MPQQVVEISFEELAKQHSDLQKQHTAFKNKVLEMLNTQQAYFKSNKDFHLLKTSKALEKEVRDLITPPPVKVAQTTMEFLGQ